MQVMKLAAAAEVEKKKKKKKMMMMMMFLWQREGNVYTLTMITGVHVVRKDNKPTVISTRKSCRRSQNVCCRENIK